MKSPYLQRLVSFQSNWLFENLSFLLSLFIFSIKKSLLKSVNTWNNQKRSDQERFTALLKGGSFSCRPSNLVDIVWIAVKPLTVSIKCRYSFIHESKGVLLRLTLSSIWLATSQIPLLSFSIPITTSSIPQVTFLLSLVTFSIPMATFSISHASSSISLAHSSVPLATSYISLLLSLTLLTSFIPAATASIPLATASIPLATASTPHATSSILRV